MSDDEIRVTNEVTGGEKGKKSARFDLLPWDVLWEDSKLYGAGADKYAERNWEKGYDFGLSIAALGRHLALWIQGEDDDEETGVSHLISVRFHCAALLRFQQTHPAMDDRRKLL